ncbi:MAG: flagellar export chaperone FliS [bacterium]
MADGPLGAYAESRILTAEPERLVLMMYEGALRFLRMARAAALEGRVEDCHNSILRAYAIIAELMATLDRERGGEIAANLERSYEFMLYRLREADIEKDPRLIESVEKLLEPLAEAWETAFFKSKGTGAARLAASKERCGPDTYSPGGVPANGKCIQKETLLGGADIPAMPSVPGSLDVRG